jgi:N-alpha-acetyltransferase 30
MTTPSESLQAFKDISLSEREDSTGIKINDHDVSFVTYTDERQLQHVKRLVDRDLSEPYSIYTYRYFLSRFPDLCIFAVLENHQNMDDFDPIGCIVCKIDPENEDELDSNNFHQSNLSQYEGYLSGYIGMLAVDSNYRRYGLGQALVRVAVQRLRSMGCSSVLLETESSNKAAMKLYEEKMGFVREQFLPRYYLNNSDAYRLRLWLT